MRPRLLASSNNHKQTFAKILVEKIELRCHQPTHTISDKMVGGAWRRPRMKVYDYNQEFGGNYYQVAKNCLVSLYIRLYVCE